jgi:hypothetical protein
MLQVNIPVIQTSNFKARGAIANHCDLATSDHDREEIEVKMDELVRIVRQKSVFSIVIL